jgi:hypothetical protein
VEIEQLEHLSSTLIFSNLNDPDLHKQTCHQRFLLSELFTQVAPTWIIRVYEIPKIN